MEEETTAFMKSTVMTLPNKIEVVCRTAANALGVLPVVNVVLGVLPIFDPLVFVNRGN